MNLPAVCRTVLTPTAARNTIAGPPRMPSARLETRMAEEQVPRLVQRLKSSCNGDCDQLRFCRPASFFLLVMGRLT